MHDTEIITIVILFYLLTDLITLFSLNVEPKKQDHSYNVDI